MAAREDLGFLVEMLGKVDRLLVDEQLLKGERHGAGSCDRRDLVGDVPERNKPLETACLLLGELPATRFVFSTLYFLPISALVPLCGNRGKRIRTSDLTVPNRAL
jgi:hypothetical protein